MPTMTTVSAAVLGIAAGLNGGGGPGADPTLPAFSAVAAQLSADTIPAQGDNTNLTSWQERVSGISLRQLTGANQPKYRTARVGGKPSVQAIGSTWLSAAIPGLKAVVDTKNYTVMIVVANVVAQANGTIFGNAAGGNSFAWQANGTGTGRFDSQVLGSSLTLAPDATPAFRCFGSSSWAVNQYAGQSGVGLERAYMEGGCVNSNTGFAPASSSADGQFAVGATNSLGQLSGKADILEVVVWNRGLTAIEWVMAEIWACTKYSQALPWAAGGKYYILDGDSLTVGVGTPSINSAYPYLAMQNSVVPYGAWTMQAVGGLAWPAIIGKVGEWTGIPNLIGIPGKVAAFEWYNENLALQTPAQILQHTKDYSTALNKAGNNLKLALGSSTSYSGDSAGGNRDLFNTLLDADHAHADSYAQLHLDTHIGLGGAASSYSVFSGTLWADIVHINAAGRAFLWPLMNTALQAI